MNIGQWINRWENSFLLDGSFPAQTTTSKRKGSSFLSAPILSLLNPNSHSRFHNFIMFVLGRSSLDQQSQCSMRRNVEFSISLLSEGAGEGAFQGMAAQEHRFHPSWKDELGAESP